MVEGIEMFTKSIHCDEKANGNLFVVPLKSVSCSMTSVKFGICASNSKY